MNQKNDPPTPAGLNPEQAHAYHERAGIMEYDGHLPRQVAEAVALAGVRRANAPAHRPPVGGTVTPDVGRLYNVTIEYLGSKKQYKFPQSTICLGKEGALLVMDSEGKRIRFDAKDCKVEQIAAHVIIIRGYTERPRSITAYCVYANTKGEARDARQGETHE